jgi:hypothetical protein
MLGSHDRFDAFLVREMPQEIRQFVQRNATAI